MMSNECIYREYVNGDEYEVIDLLGLCFNGWPHFDLAVPFKDHWMWKYHDKSAVFFAEKDGKIIGSHLMVPCKIKIFDQLYKCGYGADVAVHPEYRKLGIHNKLLELKMRKAKELGCKFIYNMTGNPIVIKMFEKSPDFHRIPIKITSYVRIHDLGLHLEHVHLDKSGMENLGYHTLTKLWPIVKPKMREKSVKSGLVKCGEINQTKLGSFLNTVNQLYDFIYFRDSEFINWRYCDARAGPFNLRYIEEGGEILGLSVLRINKYFKEYPMGFIVDLLVDPGKRDIVDSLISDAVNFFDGNKVNAISYLDINTNKNRDILKKHGFVDSKRSPQIFLAPLQGSDLIDEIAEISPQKIHISYGDFDVV